MSQLNDRVYDTNVGKTGVSLDRVRKLFHGSAQVLVKPGSIFSYGEGQDFYYFISGIEVPYFNQVSLYTGDTDVLEEALAPFYARKVVHSVYLGGAALAHAEALKEKGYTNKGAVPLMAYALDSNADHHQLPEGLTLVRVETQTDLEVARKIMVDTYGMTEEIARSYTEPTLDDPNAFRYYLVAHGEPVATAFFFRTDKSLGCYDVATLPSQQRKGYGDELMKAVFTAHAAMGDELVLLQASDAGQHLYRRLGFQFVEYIQGWQLEEVERMRRFTHHEITLGEYKLRPIVDSDADVVIPSLNDEAMVKWMQMPSPYTEVEFQASQKRWKNRELAGWSMEWGIEKDGVLQGRIAVHHTDWIEKRTEIGYLTFPQSRGKGVMPTVLRSLVEFLFEEYKFERIEVRTDTRNVASRRVAEKAGFTLEGILRRNYINGGEITDDAIYAMIRSDLAG